MASVSGLSGVSGSSSIYGNKNVISGLASGLDTESMIENSVSGYKKKITTLQQQQQTLTWKQDAYRSIIDKMVALTKKYTSYSSSTNLFSASFFNKAVSTTTTGANAAKISATGKTSSAITINAVKQLASAAKYSTSVGNTALAGSAGILDDTGTKLVTSGGEIDWTEPVQVSDISGTMTLTYGSKTVDLNFGELDAYTSAEELAKGIKEKLGEAYITTSSGDYVKADTRIDVKVSDDGKITFSDKSGAGNSVYISGASTEMKSVLGIEPGKETDSITVTADAAGKMSHEADMTEYLSGKTVSVTLDGVTKKVTLGDFSALKDSDDSVKMTALKDSMNQGLEKAFGKGKVTVNVSGTALTFTTAKGSVLSVNSDVGKVLGLSDNGLTSYLNTSKTLGDLGVLNGLTSIRVDPTKVTEKDGKFYDEAGNLVQLVEGTGGDTGIDKAYERVDADGNPLYELKINGEVVGNFTKDTALESVLTAINSNTEAGVSVSYSKITNQFVFTARETGAAGDIDFGDSGLGVALFGSTYETDATTGERVHKADVFTAGQDAEFTATINGETIDMTRSSNVVDLDGLSVTLRDTFEDKVDADGNVIKAEAVGFTTKSDTDKIVGAIKSFIDDYNALVTELRSAYATLPAQKSNGSAYTPLTDEDKAGMTESAIEAYEEKVKQGLLFGDKDLSSLYNRLRSAITPTGNDGADLRAMGITTKYADGLTTLDLDENALKDMLERDSDKVKDAFSKTQEGGSSTNGVMYNLKKHLDAFGSTSLANTGVLVRRAGTKLSSVSLLDNTLQKQIDNLDKEVDKWQTKMSDRIDYYTRQFTALEQLMAQMNSQSSTLAGMMGGF